MLKLFSRSKSIGNGSANGLGSTGNGSGRNSGEYHSSSPSSLSAFSQTAKRQRGTSATSRKANEPATRSSGSPLKSTASALQKIARQFSFTASSSTTSASTTAATATTTSSAGHNSHSHPNFTITKNSYSPTISTRKNKGKGKNGGYSANNNSSRRRRSSVKDMSVSSASETADETSSATHSSSFSMEYSDDDGVVEYVHPVTSSHSVVNSSSMYYTDVETAKLISDLGKDTADIVLKIVDEFLPKCLNCNITDLSTMSMTTLMLCGQCVPPISLSHYISRIIRNINHALSDKSDTVDSVGVRCLLIAVIYINRLQQNVKDFQVNVLNIHRLFLIAMTDALKVNEDEHPDNKYMALVGGLDCAQLNSIETTFCVNGGFDLIINFEELQEMYRRYHSESYVLSVPENQQTYPVRRVSWESKR